MQRPSCDRSSGGKVFEYAARRKIVFQRGYITRDELGSLGAALGKSEYGKYLIEVAQNW